MQNNRSKPHAICKKSFLHTPWCFLTWENKRDIYRKLDITAWRFNKSCLFFWSMWQGSLVPDLLWHVAMRLGCTCSGFSKDLAPTMFSQSAWLFVNVPQYLFKNWVIPFGNLLKISPCFSVFIPSFSFLHALVSSVSCLSCAPCSSSFNPFVSFCWQKTVKWSWQRLLA